MYNRILRISPSSRRSCFLFGPRGTGKTFWIKSHLPDALYIDLLDFSNFKDLLANPNRLEQMIPPSFDNWIVIDEVQKIPALLNEVHRLIESKKWTFLLTGSSARSLRKKGVNLLAGRALQYRMHPFVKQELASDFNLVHALRYGLLPTVWSQPDPEHFLKTYVQTYVQEEVLQEGLTRNIGAFARFLEVASFSQGSLVNYSEIAREIGIERLVVSNYFSILEDLLLASFIQPFTHRAKRKSVAHAKFYFFDAGVFRTLRPQGFLDSREESEGAALETLFLQSLRAVNDYYDLGYSIHFWQTTTQLEVDFVLYGENGLHAFEIKRNSTLTTKMLRGLRAFGEDYPEAKLYIIYMGKRREYHGNITAIPIEEALELLPQLLDPSHRSQD